VPEKPRTMLDHATKAVSEWHEACFKVKEQAELEQLDGYAETIQAKLNSARDRLAQPDGFKFDDGGRAAAGFQGSAGDCVTRAIAIATGRNYQEVYAEIGRLQQAEHGGKRSARNGVSSRVLHRYMDSIGWEYLPTAHIHLRREELPAGPLVV